MTRTKQFNTPPKTAMNKWVQDAFRHAMSRDDCPSYDDVAAALTRAGLGTSYDKSIVQKMTTIRKVSLEGAKVISGLLGFPISEPRQRAVTLDARAALLSPARQKMMYALLSDFEAAEEVDRAAARSVPDVQD